MKLAAPGDRPCVCRVGILDTERDIFLELTHEAFAELARGHELPFLAGEGRVIDHEVDGNRRLLAGDPFESLWRFDVGDGVPDLDPFESRERDDLARGCLSDLDALQPLEGVELRDARAFGRLIRVERQ